VEVSIGTAILFFAYEVPAIAIKKVLSEQADRAIYKAKEKSQGECRDIFFTAAYLVI
jgi:GGDEF domain-containing protein